MQARITWRGRELRSAVERSTVAGMTETLEAAADRARTDHPRWKSRSGEAERSIGAEPPQREGSFLVGRIAGRARHFPFLEHGTTHMPAARTLERAGEREFPRLARRIEAHARDAR